MRAALPLILLLGLGLRILFWAPYVKMDDVQYISAAHLLARDGTLFATHRGLRVGLVAPTAVAFKVLGVTPVSIPIFPLICSMLAVVVTYVLGARCFNRKVGLLAAALYAFFPLDVIWSNHLFPSAPIALFTALALLFYIRGQDTRRSVDFFVSGLSLGVAWSVSETAVLCLLPLGLFAALQSLQMWRRGAVRTERRDTWHRPLMDLSLALCGVAVVLVLEAAFYAVITGDPLQRWNTIVRKVEPWQNRAHDALTSAIAWILLPWVSLFTEQEFGLFPYVMAPAVLYQAVRPWGSHDRLLVLWIAAIFLYSWYGTVSPTHYATLPRLPRYLSAVSIPALVVLSAFLVNRVQRRWAQGIVGLLLVTSVFCVWIDNGRAIAAPSRQLHAFMRSRPHERFVLTPPVLFDVSLYDGLEPASSITVFAQNAKQLERPVSVHKLWPGLQVVERLADVRGAHLVVTDPVMLDEVRRIPGAQCIATFETPDRLYHRLLRSPAVIGLLSLARSQGRVQALKTQLKETLSVCHIPDGGAGLIMTE